MTADDYGWNDIGYHQNAPSSANPTNWTTTNVVIKTPTLDRLAADSSDTASNLRTITGAKHQFLFGTVHNLWRRRDPRARIGYRRQCDVHMGKWVRWARLCILWWWYIAIQSCHLVCPRFYDFSQFCGTSPIVFLPSLISLRHFLSRDEIDNILMLFQMMDYVNMFMCMAEWCFAFLK